MKPWTNASFGWVVACDVDQASGTCEGGSEPEERKLSYDNRSRFYPDFFGDEDIGDVTFGR